MYKKQKFKSMLGISLDSNIIIQEMTAIIDKNPVILEIGTGSAQFTKVMYDSFPNSYIYSIDTLSNLHKKFYLELIETASEIRDRVTFIIANDFTNLIDLEKINFVIIDIGSNALNIISVLEKIDCFPNTFVMVPWSDEKKKKERLKVLNYLKDRNIKWTPVRQTSVIRILNEQ